MKEEEFVKSLRDLSFFETVIQRETNAFKEKVNL
jgi:hypothetical protein